MLFCMFFPAKHYYCGDVIVMMCFGPIVAQFTAYVLGAEALVTEFVRELPSHPGVERG